MLTKIISGEPNDAQLEMLKKMGIRCTGPNNWEVPIQDADWIRELIKPKAKKTGAQPIKKSETGKKTEEDEPKPETKSEAQPDETDAPKGDKPEAEKTGQQIEIPIQTTVEINETIHYPPGTLAVTMYRGVEAEATDLHLSTGDRPRWRINLELTPVPDMVEHLTDKEILTFFDQLLITGYNTNNSENIKHHLETAGWADFAFTIDKAIARGNIYKQRDGYAMALRFFHRKHVSLPFLGMEHMLKFAQWDQGMILITGPTGSGKTTVVSAMLDWLNHNENIHIATIEDPVEYPIKGIKAYVTQRSVTDGHVVDFADGLKSLMRQDPDVITIGEIRDREVLRQVLSAAETGHLVMSTMHAGSVSDAYARMTGMFHPEEQDRIRTSLAGIPTVIVHQRLIPSPKPGVATVVHELFHNKCAGAFATIRQGEWVSIQNLQTSNSDMRHWDKEIARLVKKGKLTQERARNLARDATGYEHFLASK